MIEVASRSRGYETAEGPRGLGARELVAGLAAGRWKSEQLTKSLLADIRARDRATHAVAFCYEEEALAEARELDRRRAAGEPLGPLQGLPMTVKDSFRIRDRRTTYGFSHYRSYRCRADSEVIRVLKDAGAIIVGRTAVPTAVFDWNCKNQVYEECVNPRDPQRTPGGSSGGAAAALALGLTPVELGSDIAGSIRYPAHCCGVFGLRTTDGWLPSVDFGPEDVPPAFERFAVCGPMARSFDDLELLLDVLAARYPLPPRPKRESPARKVAFSESILIGCDARTASALRTLRESLAAKNYDVRDARPALDYEQTFRDWCLIVGFEYVSAFPKWLGFRSIKKLALDRMVLRKLGKGLMTRTILEGASLARSDYERALERVRRVRETVDTFFEQYHAWVLPCSPAPAIPLRECGATVSTPRGDVEYARFLGAYMLPTTVMGTPAVAFPAATDDGALPIGVQVHGARFADRDLLREVASWPVEARVAPIDVAR